MAKIPLERTIESTYRFAFTNILSVFGVLWLPYLLLGCVVAGVFYLSWPDLQALLANLPATPQEGTQPNLSSESLNHIMALGFAFARFAGLIVLLSVIARAMVSVGVLRKALGLHEGPVFFYFSLAAPVWRMIGAMLLAVVIIWAVALATCLAAFLVVMGTQKFSPSATGIVTFVVGAAAILWIIYMSVRLVFFLPAVVVAEERIGLGRSWELGGGNFWRIVVVLIAVMFPVMIVAGIVQSVLFGNLLWTPEMQASILAKHPLPPQEIVSSLLHQLHNVWPFFLLYFLVYVTLLTGLGLGVMANAYKAVTETKGEA